MKSKDRLVTLPVRGKWWWKEVWFSICSKHGSYHDDNCRLCNTGMWENLIVVKLSNLFYKLCPNLWRVWANRGRK